MRLSFEMIEHKHAEMLCRVCHIHYHPSCMLQFHCSDPKCGMSPRTQKNMPPEDCIFCAGISTRCRKCSSYFQGNVFPKCPFCFFEEMKPLWERAFTPGKVRTCRCNRCHG